MPVKKLNTRKKPATAKKRVFFVYLLFIILVGAGGAAYWRYYHKTPQAYAPPKPPPSWRLKKIANDHQVEGYASSASVAPGGTIDLHVSCRAGSYRTDVFRMGWYGGSGARYVAGLGSRSCQKNAIPAADKSTGLVNLDWPISLRLHIQSGWRPGVYLAKLTAGDGYQNYVPFTVRSAAPQSKYLFVHSINTDLAYNEWGGNSLYTGSTPDLKIPRAVEASLNRPFAMPGNHSLPGAQNDGSGDFLIWEYPMVKFLEQHNYGVDYATDVDIHEHPGLLLKYKAVIITGHDEYWSKQMRDGYQAAVNHGVRLAVFGANTAFRPVRFEPDPKTGQPDRIMVNYKSDTLDPFTKTNPQYSTPAAWRLPPLNQPETELLGIAYEGETADGAAASGDLLVSDASSWVFKDSGLKNGDKIPGLVGYEYDRFNDSLSRPDNIDIIFHSPLTNYNGKPDFADSSYYALPSGGQVFDAGTIQWSWGLDPSKPTYSPPLVKITENILNRFGSSPSKNRCSKLSLDEGFCSNPKS